MVTVVEYLIMDGSQTVDVQHDEATSQRVSVKDMLGDRCECEMIVML